MMRTSAVTVSARTVNIHRSSILNGLQWTLIEVVLLLGHTKTGIPPDCLSHCSSPTTGRITGTVVLYVPAATRCRGGVVTLIGTLLLQYRETRVSLLSTSATMTATSHATGTETYLPTFALTPGNEPLTPRRTATTSSRTRYTYDLAVSTLSGADHHL